MTAAFKNSLLLSTFIPMQALEKFHIITALCSDLRPTNPMHPCRENPEETRLEFVELLNSLSGSGKHAENIESDLG